MHWEKNNSYQILNILSNILTQDLVLLNIIVVLTDHLIMIIKYLEKKIIV